MHYAKKSVPMAYVGCMAVMRISKHTKRKWL